ncbi:hypothetical protein MHYP_G00222070 [Metynnis hypsauchen]
MTSHCSERLIDSSGSQHEQEINNAGPSRRYSGSLQGTGLLDTLPITDQKILRITQTGYEILLEYACSHRMFLRVVMSMGFLCKRTLERRPIFCDGRSRNADKLESRGAAMLTGRPSLGMALFLHGPLPRTVQDT